PHGCFGENLTIRGLDESQLHVGDILSVGDEVRLSVAGPRIPCFKLCWRLNQPDTFIREFGLSGKSGAYFNVDRPGTIQAGDPVRIVSSANDSFRIGTIAEDRKSTRLNSSHVKISYAVFCLKKKKN